MRSWEKRECRGKKMCMHFQMPGCQVYRRASRCHNPDATAPARRPATVVPLVTLTDECCATGVVLRNSRTRFRARNTVIAIATCKKQYKIGPYLLWNGSRKSRALYRTVTFLMTLSDIWWPIFQISALFYTAETDNVHASNLVGTRHQVDTLWEVLA